VPVFENRVLRKIFESYKEGEIAGWGKLYSDKLSDFFSLPNKIMVIKSRRMSWTRYVARMVEKRNAYRFLVEKPGRKKASGRICRWEGNTKIDLIEIGWEDIKRIYLVEDVDKWWVLVDKWWVLVDTAMNVRAP
jgi:hypothetical protein